MPALTAKQKAFATKVASGMPKTKAFRTAYPDNHSGSAAIRTDASRTSLKPAVRNEIERLQLLTLPAVEDMYALRQHARAVLVDLSKVAKSEDTRAKCAMYLDQVATATIAAQQASPGPERQDILAELRVLYHRAMKTTEKPHPTLTPALELEGEIVSSVTATSQNPGPDATGE
jgi:hypothetical protein